MNSLFLRVACLAVVMAMTLRCDISGPQMGAIQGTVSMGDSPGQGIQVSLRGPAGRIASTVANGSFTFTDLPLGAYTVSAAVAGATCNSATVDVQAGQTAPVSIACDQIPGSIGGTVLVDGMPIGRNIVNGVLTQIAEVVLSGPAGNRTTSTGANGRFAFDTLPPGSYALTVSLADDFLFTFTCESITLTVQAYKTAEAGISCTKHPIPEGKIGGQVTINGEARPIVWVELERVLQHGPTGFPWASGTTIPSGRWEFDVPAGDYVVVIKAPPGLTCDAMRKSATVRENQTTIVNFACVGEVKGSIQGFTYDEFGTYASARVTLTGPVYRETISNGDGFFAFEDLPPGVYVLDLCGPYTVTVQEGATAFIELGCG